MMKHILLSNSIFTDDELKIWMMQIIRNLLNMRYTKSENFKDYNFEEHVSFGLFCPQAALGGRNFCDMLL
jgi:hypothetical protein